MSAVRRAAAAVSITMFAAVVATSALVTAPSAQAADALLEQRTLFLDERFTQTGARPALPGSVQPEGMLAVQGEREGFQLAVNNTSGGPLTLSARVVPDAAMAAEAKADHLAFEFLRVGFIDVPQGSTGLGTSGGMYADPLPPLRTSKDAARLAIPAGQWGGLALLTRVRTDTAAGVYTGTLELFDANTTYARQPFSIDVRSAVVGGTAQPLLQNGAKGSFKTVFNVEGDAYWLQHEALRNGSFKGYPTPPDRMKQLQGLLSFLDSRGVATLEYPFANPSATGTYDCAYDSPGDVGAFGFLPQLTERYFTRTNEVSGGAQQPVRFFPHESAGCIPEDVKSAFHPTVDKYRTPSIKQDDLLNPRAASFYKTAAAAWNGSALFGQQTYVKNPFDEPSDATARMKFQMDTQVPAATTILHRTLGKRAKVVLADWPRDNTPKRVCRTAGGNRSCTTLSGDTTTNRKQWDGRGLDDADVWMAPFSRLYGRPSSPVLRRAYKVNRERQYADRLAAIRKLPGGRETWAYNFYTATKLSPQVTIDAPPTDPRMMYWQLAREGHSGLFISNVMLSWGAEVKLHPNGLRRKGPVYEQASYFKHSVYGYAAGWGNFLYPGYAPQLGLDAEADRNGENVTPVSSLRMEAMRDGQEDANLMSMYRQRFGAARLAQRMKPIFPGSYVQLPRTLGQVMGPRYNTGNNLALRMEIERRTMINELSAP